MADATKYNLNNPAVKRIMREVKEMEKEQSSMYYAKPMEVCKIFSVFLNLHVKLPRHRSLLKFTVLISLGWFICRNATTKLIIN